jgi:hypothetical protein
MGHVRKVLMLVYPGSPTSVRTSIACRSKLLL